MTYNKIPLAIGYDNNGDASGLVEFTLNLSDTGDVCNATPTDGDSLVFSAGEWCPSAVEGGGGGIGALSDATDVCNFTATPQSGYILSWNGSNWCPSSNPAPTNLGDLQDVNGGTPSEGAMLVWANTEWKPTAFALESGNQLLSPEYNVSTSSLEFTFSNVVTVPPNFTGKGDVDSGFLYFSGNDSSSTEIVGNDFGRIWVSGPPDSLASQQTLVYFSATDAVSGVRSIPVDLSFTADDTNKILRWDGTSLNKSYNDQTVIAVFNNTGSQINKGQAVYVSGPHAGGPNIAEVALAKADADATMPAVGLALEGIGISEEGSIVSFGTVIGLNTSSFTEGDIVYVSPSVAGDITTTKPTGANDHIQNIGIVIKSDASNGSIKVTGVGRENAVPNRNDLLEARLPVTFHSNFGAPVVSSNSTSLTEVTSITIPGGTLTNHGVEVEIRGRVYGQGQNLRMSFDLGGTTIMNSQISQGTASVFYGYSMLLKITRTGDNTQFVTAHFLEGGGFDAAAGHGGWSSMHREGFMYEETSANEGTDLALDFNVQHSANASGENFTIESVVARIIPA